MSTQATDQGASDVAPIKKRSRVESTNTDQRQAKTETSYKKQDEGRRHQGFQQTPMKRSPSTDSPRNSNHARPFASPLPPPATPAPGHNSQRRGGQGRFQPGRLACSTSTNSSAVEPGSCWHSNTHVPSCQLDRVPHHSYHDITPPPPSAHLCERRPGPSTPLPPEQATKPAPFHLNLCLPIRLTLTLTPPPRTLSPTQFLLSAHQSPWPSRPCQRHGSSYGGVIRPVTTNQPPLDPIDLRDQRSNEARSLHQAAQTASTDGVAGRARLRGQPPEGPDPLGWTGKRLQDTTTPWEASLAASTLASHRLGYTTPPAPQRFTSTNPKGRELETNATNQEKGSARRAHHDSDRRQKETQEANAWRVTTPPQKRNRSTHTAGPQRQHTTGELGPGPHTPTVPSPRGGIGQSTDSGRLWPDASMALRLSTKPHLADARRELPE